MVTVQGAWTWLVDLFTSSISDIALAAIVLFSGLVIARISSLLIERGLRTLKFNEALKTAFSLPFNISSIISQFVLWSIAAVSILWALRILGINTFVVSALAILAIIIITFSAIIALRDLIPNLISGVEMHRKGLIAEGDMIIFDGERARVLEAGMLETILEQGTMRIVIPNAVLLRHEIFIEGSTSPVAKRTSKPRDPSEETVENLSESDEKSSGKTE